MIYMLLTSYMPSDGGSQCLCIFHQPVLASYRIVSDRFVKSDCISNNLLSSPSSVLLFIMLPCDERKYMYWHQHGTSDAGRYQTMAVRLLPTRLKYEYLLPFSYIEFKKHSFAACKLFTDECRKTYI
jgi:hypothetical protein